MNHLRLDEFEARLPAATVCSDFDFKNHELFQAMSQFSNFMLSDFCKLWEFEENGYALVRLLSEEYAVGVSKPHPDTDEPGRIFTASGINGEVQVYGVIEGVQFNPKPFVGYIETLEPFQRQRKATRLLSVMNAASHAVYDKELSSGPQYYLSPEGKSLQGHMQKKYSLSNDEEGQVLGR